MGLDLYVGSLTRYHCGNWENAVARTARELGCDYHILRPTPEPEDTINDPAIVRDAVVAWRDGLSHGLRASLTEPLDWDETPDGEYFTAQPTWTGYAGLVLLAAHTACATPPPPEATERVDFDSAYMELEARKFQCPFSQLFDAEMWLPCDFDFKFSTEDVPGGPVWIGSSVTLLKQLERLNAAMYQAGEATLEHWSHENLGSERSFDQSARFGLALFIRHAKLSVQHRLPMKLDY